MRAEAEAKREALALCQSLTCTAGLWCEEIEITEPAENMEEENAGRRPEAVAWHALTWRSGNAHALPLYLHAALASARRVAFFFLSNFCVHT